MKVLLKIFAFTAIFLLNVSAHAQWKDTAQRTQLREVQFRRDTCNVRGKGDVWNYIDKIGRQSAMILKADYILKVRIHDLVIGLDSTYKDPFSLHEVVNVVCEVLDTIKGSKIPYNCYYPTAFKKKNKIQNCLKFSYAANRRVGYSPPSDVPLGRVINTRMVQPGEEFYIFFRQILIDSTMAYLTPLGNFEKTGGLFRIVNGRVEDIEEFWGMTGVPLEKDFVTVLQQKTITFNWPPKEEDLLKP